MMVASDQKISRQFFVLFFWKAIAVAFFNVGPAFCL
jgi:hypothetical protein